MEPDKLYAVHDAAGELGNVSVWAIYKWFGEGRLKRTKIGSRSMVKGADLQAFIASCNTESKSAPALRQRRNQDRDRRPSPHKDK